MKRKFEFLHTYESSGKYWKNIGLAGLLEKNTGVRLINSPFGDNDCRFNSTARQGGPLYNILSQKKHSFIVDRVAGGSPYLNYEFDARLLAHYTEILGDKFFGQIHEPISNTRNDWLRLKKLQPDVGIKPFDSSTHRNHFDGSGSAHWLEYGTPEDYDGETFPSNIDEFWERIRKNIKRQKRRFGGPICICEGILGELSWNEYYRIGAELCLAEIGPWSSPRRSQFMTASLRGAGLANRKKWGLYFAPWGPDGCTCFIDPEDNSWQVSAEQLTNSNWPASPEKGPSSALQRRIFFHAYIAGAHILYEEWGAECNLLSLNKEELSSYGKVTKEFLDFTIRYPDMGQPFTPIALLLNSSQNPPLGFEPDVKYPVGIETSSEQNLCWARLVSALYNAHQILDPEAICFPPSHWPELFDVIPSDTPEDIRGRYEKVFPPEELSEFMIALQELNPIERISDMPMQINHRDDDVWFVAIYNPRGASRGDIYGCGTIFDDRYTTRECLRPRFNYNSVKTLYSWPDSSVRILKNRDIQVDIKAGGIIILEIDVP